jgi:hypothetical protein
VDGHDRDPATAQVAPCPVIRGTISIGSAPAPARAAASATEGTPNRISARIDRVWTSDVCSRRTIGGLDQTRLPGLVADCEKSQPMGWRRLIQRPQNQRFDRVRGTAKAATDSDGDAHGLVVDHCVTAIAGRMA